MNFSFSEDQVLLRNSVRAALDEQCAPAHVRAMADDSRGYSEALWSEMAKLGWLGLPFAEEQGGAGLGLVELALVLEEMGRAAYPGPYFASVVLGGLGIQLGGSAAQQERWLPAIASGQARASAALLEDALDWDPASTTATATATKAGDGWRLSGLKRFVPWAHVADVVLVPARAPEGVSLFLVDPRAAGVTLTPMIGIDLSNRWSEMRLDGVAVPADALMGRAGDAGGLLDALLRRAAVGASAEMLGAARRCLDMSVGYVKVREQFGQLIGSFQAIRHRCAEMLMEVENCHSAVYYAAWALTAGAGDAAAAASICKSYVSEAARKVCGDAIQVHGGIGFTWEYDLHLYFKRAKALEPLYGDAAHHREQIVRGQVLHSDK
jgi:alkylation response protein AidB-like acyl-CoA dehydrogenase